MTDIERTATGALGAVRPSGAAAQAAYFRVAILTPVADVYVLYNPRLVFEVTTNYTDVSGTTFWDAEISTVPDFATTVLSTTFNLGTSLTAYRVTWDTTGVNIDEQHYYWRVRGRGGTVATGAWYSSSFYVDLGAGNAHLYVDTNTGQDHHPTGGNEIYIDLHATYEDNPSKDARYGLHINVGASFAPTQDINEAFVWETDVNTDTPHPIIWWVSPDVGAPGEGIKVFGFGFGDLQTTYDGDLIVNIDGEEVTASILSWQTHPPSADAYLGTRVIDRDTEEVDPQHTVIEFTIPDAAHEPGHMIHVQTDGP